MAEDSELLRTRDVALLLGVPANTLRWWRYIGEGPEWFRLGPRVVVYRASKVAAWLAEREAEGAGHRTA